MVYFGFEQFANFCAIGAIPFGLCLIAIFGRFKDAHPATTFVVFAGNFQRWQEATKRVVLDAIETIANVSAGNIGAALRFDRILDRKSVV